MIVNDKVKYVKNQPDLELDFLINKIGTIVNVADIGQVESSGKEYLVDFGVICDYDYNYVRWCKLDSLELIS